MPDPDPGLQGKNIFVYFVFTFAEDSEQLKIKLASYENFWATIRIRIQVDQKPADPDPKTLVGLYNVGTLYIRADVRFIIL